MKSIFGIIGVSLVALIISIGISSLIFWGVGSLIIWIFKINYTWTLLHGLACGLVYSILRGIFNN